MGILDDIRSAAASVASRAKSVAIDSNRLQSLAFECGEATARAAREDPDQLATDPAHLQFESTDSTLAYVITLDAINFGSGWFPVLNKRPGASGYFTMAAGLREQFERFGPWSAKALTGLDAEQCSRLFGQDSQNPESLELMALFASSLHDLGRYLTTHFGGSFGELVAASSGEAEAMVELLAEMPSYRDVFTYEELEVPFYKRAQITVADLAMAFDERGPGRFRGLDRLTLFADNLVPHVLRCEGVLSYQPELLDRINRGDRLEPGSSEEVEIRAVAVHAIELMTRALAEQGRHIRASDLDHYLWNRGQRPEIKAHPRHRCRSLYY